MSFSAAPEIWTTTLFAASANVSNIYLTVNSTLEIEIFIKKTNGREQREKKIWGEQMKTFYNGINPIGSEED